MMAAMMGIMPVPGRLRGRGTRGRGYGWNGHQREHQSEKH
jgi:hypothetical protein